MGINIPPPPPDYGDDLLTCFPAGQTPLQMNVFLTGIKKGNTWHGGLPEPPSGHFSIRQNPGDSELWEYHGDVYDLRYYGKDGPIGGGKAELEVYFGGWIGNVIFFKSVPESCIYDFESRYQTPFGNDFWDGHAFISFLE